jgi:hypothetical protein
MATVIGDMSSVASAADLTIQPASGVQWQITNILIPDEVSATLSMTDGTNEIAIDTSTTSLTNLNLQITNDMYLIVTNNDASSQYLGYTGFVIV